MPKPRLSLDIPLKTIFKTALGIAIVLAVWKLRWMIALIAFALLGAVTVEPLQRWLMKKRVPHVVSVLLVGLGVLAIGFAAWELVVPALVKEISGFKEHLADAQKYIQAHPTHSQVLQRVVNEAQSFPKSAQAQKVMSRFWSVGFLAVEGVTALVMVFVLMLYFLLDGKRLYAWLLSYVPRKHRKRAGATAEEVGRVIRAYVRGQLITCFAAGTYAFLALKILHVPAAMPLAVFAFFMDVLPVIGFIAVIVPATLLGLTVSPMTALGVAALIVAYHGIENYLLNPMVYGRQLRLSTLTVLLACLVGAELGGALGCVLMLPLVAAYPAIERHWLGGYLADETVEEHARMDSKSDEEMKEAIDEVAEDAQQHGPH